MAGINKNFVVKNGLEVNSNLIYADADNNRVGIKTNDVKYSLHVNGGIGATSIYASGISTFGNIHLSGDVIAGNAGIGSTGQYLVRTGTGVTWQNLPIARTSETFTATPGQTTFSFSYTVGLLDVFVNGVKLSTSEYTANDTASIILNTACFGDETVEFISYNSVNPGYAFTGIYGISLFEEGSPVGTTGQVVTLNFVGAAVTATATGTGATIYINDSVNENYWKQTAAGISTTSNVGIATTNPRFALEVGSVGASGTSLWVNGNARVTGILTVGSSSIVLDGSSNTINVGSGITINGNTGIVSASNFYASGIQVGVITATTIVYEGGTTLTQDWTRTAAGIHTLSNVGIGTTNPTSTLTVSGTTFTDQLNVSGVSTFSGTINANNVGAGISVKLSNSVPTYLEMLGVGNYNATLKNIYDSNSSILVHSGAVELRSGGTNNYSVFNGTIDGTGQLMYRSGAKLSSLIDGVEVNGTTFTDNLSVGTSGTTITTSSGNVGVGTTNPTQKLDVSGSVKVGINTSQGVILTSPNSTKYQIFVEDDGTLKTIAV